MTISLYTDGSYNINKNIGGWGCVILNDKNEIHLHNKEINSTNNRMEITAVIKGLEYIDTNCKNRNQILIYSDSSYVINCSQKIFKRNINLDLWEKIDNLIYGKEIKWIWVKAHSNIKYNELADKLSRKYIT